MAAGMTEEEKYARKAKMLQNALAKADEMDKADAAKEKSAKDKAKKAREATSAQRKAEKEAAAKQAAKDGEPVLT